MAERVVVRGGQDDGAEFVNAASEATLLRLVELFESKGNLAGGKTAQDLADKARKLQDSHTKSVEKSKVAYNKAADAVSKLKSAVVDTAAAIGGLVGSVLGTTVNIISSFASTLVSGTSKLSDFSKILQPIPLVGNLFHTLTVALESNVETWRKLSSVGASFNNSILNMRIAAATAEMPFNDFAQMVSNNSQVLKLLGQTVSSGTLRFSELSKQLRTGNTGKQLMAMGFSINDINESLLTYMDIQSRSGRLQRMSTGQLIEGAANLSQELDLLSRATGVNRKQIEEQIKKAALDPSWRIATMQMTEQGRQIANSLYGTISQISPELGETLKDMIDGIPNTDASKALAAGATEIADVFVKIGKQQFSSVAEATEALQVALKSSDKKLTTNFGSIIQSLQNGGGITREFYTLMGAINTSLEGFKGNVSEAAQEQQSANNYVTRSLAQFEQTISSIRDKIFLTLFQSKAFETLNAKLEAGGTQLEKFINKIAAAAVLKLNNFIAWLDDKLTELMDPNKSFTEVLSGYAASIGQQLKDWFKSVFLETLTSVFKESVAGLIEQTTTLFTKPATSTDITSAGSTSIDWTKLAATAGAVAGLGAIGFALTSVTGQIFVLGTAISGTAYSIKLLVDSLSEFQRSTIDSIKTLTSISPDKFFDAALGITALSDSLDKFTPGIWSGLTKGISEFLGGSTVEDLTKMGNSGVQVQYLADALKQVDFNKLDSSAVDFDVFDDGAKKVEELSMKIKGLKNSMNDISSPSITATFETAMKSISDSINQLVPEKSSADATASAISALGSKLDQMNLTLNDIKRLQNDALPNIKKTARNTKNPNLL